MKHAILTALKTSTHPKDAADLASIIGMERGEVITAIQEFAAEGRVAFVGGGVVLSEKQRQEMAGA